MSIKQITLKNIPKTIFRKGWSFSFFSGAKDIYFVLDKDLIDCELWEITDKITDLPSGVIALKSLGKYNYIRVTYYPEEITEESIINFVKDLNFTKISHATSNHKGKVSN